MIEAYTGTPGSGKTYHAVHDIWNRLKYGYPVVTNIPLNLPTKTAFGKSREWTNCKVLDNADITPKWLMEYSEKVRNFLGVKRLKEDYIWLVVDEAQLLFNCRDWNAKGRQEWIKFFQLHRKLGYHIVLITQMSKMLDKQVFGLLEYECIHRKFSSYGLRGVMVSLMLFSPTLFASVRMWSALRTRIDSKVLRYNRHIAKLYDTSQLF